MAIIPPKRTARQQTKNPIPVLKERDEAIWRIKELGDEGRAEWKKEVGYHRRSNVETHMFRHKTILGDRLSSRRESSQATEIAIKWDVLNRMTEQGMPKSYKVGGYDDRVMVQFILRRFPRSGLLTRQVYSPKGEQTLTWWRGGAPLAAPPSLFPRSVHAAPAA